MYMALREHFLGAMRMPLSGQNPHSGFSNMPPYNRQIMKSPHVPITLTATEFNRLGLAALEQSLEHGPVHVTRRNKPVAVVLSVKQYQRLVDTNAPAPVGMTAVQWLLAQTAPGRRSKRMIDAALKSERAW